MTPKIKPCPFCGGKAEYKKVCGDGAIYCLDCDARGSWNPENKAIKEWNKRWKKK